MESEYANVDVVSDDEEVFSAGRNHLSPMFTNPESQPNCSSSPLIQDNAGAYSINSIHSEMAQSFEYNRVEDGGPYRTLMARDRSGGIRNDARRPHRVSQVMIKPVDHLFEKDCDREISRGLAREEETRARLMDKQLSSGSPAESYSELLAQLYHPGQSPIEELEMAGLYCNTSSASTKNTNSSDVQALRHMLGKRSPLTGPDPDIKYRAKAPPKKRIGADQGRADLYLTDEMLLPLPFDSDCKDMSGTEAIKYVKDKSTDADDGGAFLRRNIGTNAQRPECLAGRTIHREDRQEIKGRLIPSRPKKKYTRDAWHSVHSTGRRQLNEYVRMTDEAYDDVVELGERLVRLKPPLFEIMQCDVGAYHPVNVNQAKKSSHLRKNYCLLNTERHLKGLSGKYIIPPSSEEYVEAVKVQSIQHEKPLYVTTYTPLNHLGKFALVQRVIVNPKFVQVAHVRASRTGNRDIKLIRSRR